MFQARLPQGNLLKKLIDAIRDLITEGNVDVSEAGMQLQAMDTSHVCLIAFMLRSDGFEEFRCDRSLTLGIPIGSMQKLLKCAGNNDIITLKADDSGEMLTLMYEDPKADRVSDFSLKLMDIDSEHLAIPETEYSATVRMPASDYARIVKDLATIGDTVDISTSKDAVKFSTSGDIGTANVTVRSQSGNGPDESTTVELSEPVAARFGLKYLTDFAKGASLSSVVKLSMSKDLPLVVEYTIDDIGYLKYYLAPKIDDDEMGEAEGMGDAE